MAGIYVHIPFCRRACHYCDFHFTTNLRNANRLVDAICTEVQQRSDYLNGGPISTIYFGGGTPTLLPTYELDRILNAISKHHSIASNAELTVEANPEDLNSNKLKELQTMGANRLSLGTQSFIESELKWMNRMHSVAQATNAIRSAQDFGFGNISIDLIFGLPNQTLAQWEFNLAEALKLHVQHISSYALTVEEKTVLHSRIKKGLQQPPDDDRTMAFFRMNMEVLPAHGFEHYEISNYAQSGYISQHNSSYWKGIPYLGLGPSAHSYVDASRQWNVRSNAGYINGVSNGSGYFELEELTETDRLNEAIMIGLRTQWGVAKNTLEAIRPGAWKMFVATLPALGSDHFQITDHAVTLTSTGKQRADGLASELFFD